MKNKAQELSKVSFYIYLPDEITNNISSDLSKKENDSYTAEDNKKLILNSIENAQLADTSTWQTKEDKFESSTNEDSGIPVKVDMYSVLSSALEDEIFETGIANNSEKIFLKEFGVDRLGALNTISTLFMDNVAETGRKLNNLIGILHMISHLDYNKVYPIGQMLATCALNNKNNEVAEYGIKCFENWAHEDGIRILSSVNFSCGWVQEYADEIIEELENR